MSVPNVEANARDSRASLAKALTPWTVMTVLAVDTVVPRRAVKAEVTGEMTASPRLKVRRERRRPVRFVRSASPVRSVNLVNPVRSANPAFPVSLRRR